jgi:prolyl-tRNA editing enzyme YbaK/EbsC (Cys-tRNA(Pro) deacylase)
MAATLKDLEARVSLLERKRLQAPADVAVTDEQIWRARQAVQGAHIHSSVWKWVPENYYQRSLAERATALGALNVEYLCKSLLLENRKVVQESPDNPRFVLVILQYAAALDTQKLCNVIRRLLPVSKRLDVSKYDFRIAAVEDNDRITGYQHNSVTPFGLREPVRIVMTENVVQLGFFWMGGGHVHLKLGMATSEFCKALDTILGDISNPRLGQVSVADMED